MSFNLDPKWAKIDIESLRTVCFCPLCFETFNNFESRVQIILEGDYYTARHIPQQLTFTCENEECIGCDEEFSFELEVKIFAKYIGESK